METQEIDFALNFMLEHPDTAARVLESSELPRVAEFISNAPENYITPVMGLMLPEFAARLIVLLTPAKAAQLMEELDVNVVAGILRLSQRQTQADIIAELPTSHGKSVSLLLDYSPRTVGAWMTPHCLSMPGDANAEDACEYLKHFATQDNVGEYMYIVNREGLLLGRTDILSILRSSETQPLSSIMSTGCPALPGLMLLEQALEHKAWKDTDSLPVVSRQQRFLGVIRHSSLRMGLMRLQTTQSTAPSVKDPVSNLFEVYGQSLLALFNTVSAAVENDEHK